MSAPFQGFCSLKRLQRSPPECERLEAKPQPQRASKQEPREKFRSKRSKFSMVGEARLGAWGESWTCRALPPPALQ